MLKVKFMQYKNVVIMEILEQTMGDYERLQNEEFKASNGFRLECDEYPEIYNETKIFLKGASERNTTCYDFETKEEAQNFVVQASIAIKEYNSTVTTKNIPEEQIHTTIIAM